MGIMCSDVCTADRVPAHIPEKDGPDVCRTFTAGLTTDYFHSHFTFHFVRVAHSATHKVTNLLGLTC